MTPLQNQTFSVLNARDEARVETVIRLLERGVIPRIASPRDDLMRILIEELNYGLVGALYWADQFYPLETKALHQP